MLTIETHSTVFTYKCGKTCCDVSKHKWKLNTTFYTKNSHYLLEQKQAFASKLLYTYHYRYKTAGPVPAERICCG